MPTYLTPGVYVEEVQSGARPIEGVGTAVAAFVGFAETGPFHQPTLVTNWDQYVQAFGSFTGGTYLAHAVYGYFANGGGAAYVVRIGGPAQGSAPAAVARPPRPRRSAASWSRPCPAPAPTSPSRSPTRRARTPPEDRFKLVVRQGDKVAETYDVSTRKNVKGYVLNQVRESKLIEVAEQPGATQTRPEKQSFSLVAAPPPPAASPGSTRPSTSATRRPHRIRRSRVDRRDHDGRGAGPDERATSAATSTPRASRPYSSR